MTQTITVDETTAQSNVVIVADTTDSVAIAVDYTPLLSNIATSLTSISTSLEKLSTTVGDDGIKMVSPYHWLTYSLMYKTYIEEGTMLNGTSVTEDQKNESITKLLDFYRAFKTTFEGYPGA